jgi:hypothetical protein
VHEWMAAVDTIITKAGPGTIAEALISGLPILLNGNVPCQVGRGLRAPRLLPRAVGAAGAVEAWGPAGGGVVASGHGGLGWRLPRQVGHSVAFKVKV